MKNENSMLGKGKTWLEMSVKKPMFSCSINITFDFFSIARHF